MQYINRGNNLQLENYYFVATEVYLGDKRSAYSHNLSFALLQTVPIPADLSPNVTFTVTNIPLTTGDVILGGRHTDFTLVASLPSYPSTTGTFYTVRDSLIIQTRNI